MESRLAVINSVNESFQNWILSWKDSVGELLKIKDNTNETKVCELIETATGILIIPDSLEAYHCLPSGQNDKLIIKFSRGKMLKWFCSKKKTAKGLNPRSIRIESGKVCSNESLRPYYKFL